VSGIRGGSSEERIIKHADTSPARPAGATTSLLRIAVGSIGGSSGEEGIIDHAYTSAAPTTTTTTHRGQSRRRNGRGGGLR
jgi:hypothetical protein